MRLAYGITDLLRLPLQTKIVDGRTKTGNALAVLIKVDDFDARARELGAFCATDVAYGWLASREPFVRMRATLKRLARSGSAPFCHPFADYWLVRAVAMALTLYTLHIESRVQPRRLTRKDWDAAIASVQCLRELEDRGVVLSRTLQSIDSAALLPSDWLVQLEAKLVEWRALARKPHSDERATDRYAAREFVQWLLVQFNEVPVTLAENFGRLIDYDSDALRKHVPKWIDEYRAGVP